jgi:hypothetical protein
MKRTGFIIGGIVVIAVLLGAAAFVGGKLFNAQIQSAQGNNSSSGPRKLVTPAAGVPGDPPTARGDVDHRDGNSLFLCEPNEAITINKDGSVNKESTCASTVEVVIGHDTVFLHDVTAQRNPVPNKQGQDYIIQQAIEPGTADDIAQNTAVRAWGDTSGNRVIARTILYWNRIRQAQ